MTITANADNPSIMESYNGHPLDHRFKIIKREGKYVFGINKYQFASGISKGVRDAVIKDRQITAENVDWKYFYSSLGESYNWEQARVRALAKHYQFVANKGI